MSKKRTELQKNKWKYIDCTNLDSMIFIPLFDDYKL